MVDFLELPEVDHEGHFRALSDLADSLDEWVEKWATEADKAVKSKPKHEHQVDAVISVYQHAGFVEMARSHALICSITAFCESLFKTQLPLLHWSFKGTLPSNHPRVAQFVSSPTSFWDPTRPTKVEKGEKREGLVNRVLTILTVGNFIGLFGTDFKRCLDALFVYRNEMMHNGYEWSEKRREQFKAQIGTSDWKDWFSCSTRGDEPWYYYATPLFRKTALTLCERSLAAFDAIILGDSDRLTALEREERGQTQPRRENRDDI